MVAGSGSQGLSSIEEEAAGGGAASLPLPEESRDDDSGVSSRYVWVELPMLDLSRGVPPSCLPRVVLQPIRPPADDADEVDEPVAAPAEPVVEGAVGGAAGDGQGVRIPSTPDIIPHAESQTVTIYYNNRMEAWFRCPFCDDYAEGEAARVEGIRQHIKSKHREWTVHAEIIEDRN